MGDDAPLGTTSSPRRTRYDPRSLSNASNPPEELLNVYKRIEEDGTLAEYVSVDRWDTQADARPASRLSLPSSSAREHNHGLGLHDRFTSPEGSLLEASIGTNSPRRRTSDYTRDEQRLKRVTGGQSPVFSKAKVGARAALTADNLQRREDEIQHENVSDEGNEGREGRRLSLNLPSTWGSRAARRQDWLRNVSGGSHETKDERAAPGDHAEPKEKIEQETAPRPVFSSSRSFDRRSRPIQNALESSIETPTQDARDPTEDQKTGLHENAPPDDGAPIPNTPIVVYKSSTFARPSPSKRDSQDLLRKLSRTESPKLEQMKTPDPPKLFERKIYDKTPRVTGAWIDTPMTERVSDPPINARIDLNKEILPPTKNSEVPAPQIGPSVNAPPLPEPKRASPDASTSKETVPELQPTENSRPPLARPKLPKSALETVMEDVNSGKDTLDLTDDTIESLQAIIEGPVEQKSEEEDEEAYEKEVLYRLSLAESKSQNSVDFDRLGDKLQSLQRSITEVRKGLVSLEEHAFQDSNDASRPEPPTKDAHKTPHLHAGEACQACHVQPDGRVYAAIPLPRLWTRDLPTGRLQLTKLGWFTLVSLAWYVIECMMWENYGQPNIADSCNGYCIPADAPDFPWVTATMVWRWSHLSTILAPIITLGVFSFRLITQLLGLSDGFVDEPPSLGNLIGEIRVNGTSVSFPWLSSLSESSAMPPPQAPPQQQPPQQPPQPVWTPRFEVQKENPVRWAADQPSMDDDEYL